jgi:hypothetical protein
MRMTHDTAMYYLDLLAVRAAELNEAITDLRRQSIRGCVFLLIADITDREEAILAAHAAGLLTSPYETLKTDLLKVVQPWIPTKKAANEK